MTSLAAQAVLLLHKLRAFAWLRLHQCSETSCWSLQGDADLGNHKQGRAGHVAAVQAPCMFGSSWDRMAPHGDCWVASC